MAATPKAYGIEYRGHVIRIGADALIGRSPACKVILDHPDVSRRHARLAIADDGLFIEDLGSANGVFVNGERVEERRLLRVDDRITIGEEAMRFLGAAPSPPRPRPRARREIEASSIAIGELWDDEHDASFDRGEVTAHSSVVTKLAITADSLADAGDSSEADATLTAAFDHIFQRAQKGTKISANEIGAVAAVALKLARTGSGRIDWMERTGALFQVTGALPPPALLARLSTALEGSSPEARSTWLAYRDALRSRSAPLDSPSIESAIEAAIEAIGAGLGS